LTPKQSIAEHTISEESAGTSRLLMSVMTKKLNEKYAGSLNDQQKSIIKAYALSSDSNDMSHLKIKLEEVRHDLSNRIDSYIEEIKELPHLRTKLLETRSELMNENIEEVNDSLITKFMIYSKLRTELDAKE